ncbi:FadR/GntR family transcriptional regulator [Sphingomonas sp. Leaf343]|uniref:FadR/GntR family transcriptional regulator n=1 Tax=Sphingomonas sp. Leaf343 TaxID=1736345 RepID=UPI0009E6F2FE|nr:FadR/GntR family transcriptional regulator [Sphingomonas sp. Leaf343]
MNEALLNERLPVRKRRPSLVDSACEHIRSRISEGEHWPGTQLPTEAEYVESLGVSRTVVREAVARLAAEGLVEARQGKGVFVSETARYQAFQITRDELDNLSDVVQLLELRLGVETEMAGLAAERRSDVDLMDMRRQLKILGQSDVAMDRSVMADVAFHKAIAKASRNAYYVKLIEFLGVRLVPPRSMFLRRSEAYMGDSYRAVIGGEHEAILEAIAARDPDRAHSAARTHMSESLKRHRAIQKSMED